MKLSELIKQLRELQEELGSDIECRYLRIPKVTSIHFSSVKQVYENMDDEGKLYIAIE